MPIRPLKISSIFLFSLFLCHFHTPALAVSTHTIGVLSHRGDEATLAHWGPTAAYLQRVMPNQRFEILPLGFDEVGPATEAGRVDFILVNPGIYVNLEVRYRVLRIATLNNQIGNQLTNLFGGVVFTRSDRENLNALEDLRGRTVSAVDEISLGGYQMAWGELRKREMEPRRDFASLNFGGTHDDVVMAVLEGRVDAGMVRTNILERMADAERISLQQIKVLNPQQHADFAFLHSTRLFPEWPFSALQHTDKQLAQQVSIALLSMRPDDPAAIAGNYGGWSIPLDYQPVHDLFASLKLPPYDKPSRFTLKDAVKRYWYWVLIGGFVLLFMAFMTTWVASLYRALQRAKAHLDRQHDLILDSVAEGIYGVDMQGNSTFFNHAAEKITGWSAEEVINRNQHSILHHSRANGEPFPPHECPVYQTFRDQTARFVDEDTFWTRDGKSIPVEYSSTPVRDDHGVVTGAVVVFRDISERKQSEEKLAQHQADLAHMARISTMGEMASGLAHELNQPLTAVATNTHTCIHLLKKDEDNRIRVLEVMDRIANQAERAGKIIQQLRMFMRKEEPQQEPVAINQLIQDVLVMFRIEARKAEVKIELDLGEDLPCIKAQQIQIEQVILNLLKNSVDAMRDALPAESVAESPPHKMVIRTVAAGENAVIFSLEDNGPGVKKEELDRLFDPFFTTKKYGVGLGLSISRRIIESHDGRLYIDQNYKNGTKFLFVLPACKREVTDE